MKIKIQNFRGISNAEIEIPKGGICLIGGLNYQGKTSIAQAVGCLVSGNTLPLNIEKSQIQYILHEGTTRGSVESDNPRVKISWPQCHIEGTSAGLSATATGMESVLDMDVKTRAKFLNEILHAEPEFSDLELKLKESGLNSLTESLWKNIQGLGWDSTYSKAKETGAKLKGGWEEITGDNYGSAKAANWIPDNWDATLDAATEADLKARVDQAREFVEASIAHAAVSQEQVGRLKSAADSIPGYMEELMKVGQKLEEPENQIKIISKRFESLPRPKEDGECQPCPKCHALLRVSGGKIVVADTSLTKEAQKKVAEDRAACSKKLDELEKERQHLLTHKIDLERKFANAKDAREQLANVKPEKDESGTNDAKQRFALAESRLKAYQKKTAAEAKSKSIATNQVLCAILGPEGLRKEKLQTKLLRLNNGLKNICDIGRWGLVGIGFDLDVTYRGMPLSLRSRSEEYLSRVTLQIAFSLLLNQKFVIIDGLDILDKRGRNGLFSVIMKYQITALVCSTIYDKKDLPDLSKIGGRSYWVEGGCISG